jgi:hypothetical protein
VYRDEYGCGCLIGTLAIARGCSEGEIAGITPNADRPAERFFLAIKKGDTPANSQVARIVVDWVDEWLCKNGNAAVSAAQ